MPRPRLPTSMIFTVQLLLECGESDRSIYKKTSVSRATIRNIRLSLMRYGEPYPPQDSGAARAHVRRISREVEDALIEHLDEFPDTHYKDLVVWLRDEHQVVAGISTVWRALKNRGWERPDP